MKTTTALRRCAHALLPAFLPLMAWSAQPAPELSDSSRHYALGEAVVTAAPREHAALRRQAVASSSFGESRLRQLGAGAVKGLTAHAPNLYLPDYGSRLTSAAYVRGVGSRSGTPAVGLYVDDVPYADKAAYDFQLFEDVERIDLLRGPQGTLYGRGAMGGLLRVTTADPLRRSGTDIHLGGSTREAGRHASATTYLHPSRHLGLSLSGFLGADEGFRHNSTTGHKADGSDVAGLRLRTRWMPTEHWRIDYTAAYHYSREQSNPYVLLASETGAYYPDRDGVRADDLLGRLSQNRQSTYRRSLFSTGLTAQWQGRSLTFTSITAYQGLADRLFMDQDYMAADIFSLEQRQRLHSISEELTLKGRRTVALPGNDALWEWTAGAFLLHDTKRTTCPVDFYADGIGFLNATFRSVMPPFIQLTFTDPSLRFYASLRSPGTNAALYHESTLRDLFTPGLSLTLGLRLDYDRHSLRLHAPGMGGYAYRFRLQMPAYGLDLDTPFSADAAFGGRDGASAWQLLPKVAVTYELPGAPANIYFAVSKGYRSGGYNMENYSDLSQALLRRNIMLQVRDYSTATITALDGLSEQSKAAAIAGMGGMIAANLPAAPQVAQLAYKPEYTWSHEVGTHLDLAERTVQLDAAVFLLRTHDLQIARFAPSGMGREVVNAGSSRTWGAEATLRATLLAERLALHAAYGFAHSTFTDYDLGMSQGVRIDYSGRRVPYAPEHTLAVGAAFRQPLRHGFFKAVSVGADITGAGKIYWDEGNTFAQPFSVQLGANCTVELPHDIVLNVWGRNLTATRYATFSFTSMARRFAQYGDPRHFGAELRIHF